MLRFQAELERLPVPTLEDTCALYLRLVQPLLKDDAELAATRRAVVEFLRPEGEGRILQQRLLHWSETVAPDNWLEPFWDDWYLCDDTPLVVNVSPGFVLAGSSRPQVARAAGLLTAAARFKLLVDREQLEPDVERGAPRCMSEYPRILASTRVPGPVRDRLERFPESRHVVVARNGRLFSLNVLDEQGHSFGVEDLERALALVVEDARVGGVPVGVLTTDRRRTWAGVREEHLEHGPPATREALRAIESAILLLVLESDAPPAHPRSSEGARLALHGDVRERWFDKSIQLVVAENGVAGFCMEHAGFDGSTALRFAEFLTGNETALSSSVTATPSPGLLAEPLSIEPTEPLLEAIEHSQRRANRLVARTDLAVLDVRDCGKDAIAAHRLSPDGFVQMAFQLAYFSLTGATASTYESVDTKRFLHGRTEAMRSVSPESVAFVASLRSARGIADTSERLLRAAVDRHADTVRRCREGRGVERHLLGLRRMLEPGERMPALFEDRGYETLSRSVLSTSSLRAVDGVELVCFGPVVEEGFGLSYTILQDSLRVVVTNFHGHARAFADRLEDSLVEMRSLLERRR